MQTETMSEDKLQARVLEEIAEMKRWRSPSNMEWRLQDIINLTSKVDNRLKELEVKFRVLLEGNFIEIVANSKIRQLYKMSGTTQKELADYFKISPATAQKYCSGEIEDIMTRHKIVKYFERKIMESKDVDFDKLESKLNERDNTNDGTDTPEQLA